MPRRGPPRREKSDKRGSVPSAMPSVLEPMPSADAIGDELRWVLEMIGEKEAVKEKVMSVGISEWIVHDYRQIAGGEAGGGGGGQRDQPSRGVGDDRERRAHHGKLDELAVLIRTQPREWSEEFIMLRGMNALCSLLQLSLQKQARSSVDYGVMTQALRCLGRLMNVELGMEAMVGGSAFGAVQEAIAGSDDSMRSEVEADDMHGLYRLAQCIDNNRESVTACEMQKEALLLLGAAVQYSTEAHEKALAAFDQLKRERRRVHRFFYLVESCHAPGTGGADGASDRRSEGSVS